MLCKDFVGRGAISVKSKGFDEIKTLQYALNFKIGYPAKDLLCKDFVGRGAISVKSKGFDEIKTLQNSLNCDEVVEQCGLAPQSYISWVSFLHTYSAFNLFLNPPTNGRNLRANY